MNISTLAKILGTSINDLRDTGQKAKIYGFSGRNTRIPYNSALEITKILKPDKLTKIKNDDRIYLPAVITVVDFAETIGKPAGNVIKIMVLNGVMATLNEKIDYDTAELIASELGIEVFPETQGLIDASAEDNDLAMIKVVEYDSKEDKVYTARAPVVTVMGHVDHGKTTLLDTIRKSDVVSTEAGAITQHISSYKIEYMTKNPELLKSNMLKGDKGGFKMTFVDTPGHEAFAAMRARGTQLADFIILVVSAVEGPKPQTVEVIERAKLSKTPVIVAINKIDLPDADIERVKGDLAGFGLTPEEWGGETPFIPISAKKGENLEKLIETILTFAELADLKGEINCPAQAVVIESHMDKNIGVTATVLVVKDVLKVGSVIRCGEYVAKVKRLETTEGKMITEARIAEPVVLIGLPEVVSIGEPIITYESQKQAVVDANIQKLKNSNKRVIAVDRGLTGSQTQINVILKADVSGSLEALKDSIIKIPQDKVKVFIKADSVGEITEGDIEFAKITNSTILAFHTKYTNSIESMLEKTKVGIVSSDIIYEILNWIEEEIVKNTKYEIRIDVLGRAEVLSLFRAENSNQQVFGGEVKEGKITSNKTLRVMRGEKDMGRVEVVELQRNKVKTSDVILDQQFGMAVTGKVQIKKGDFIESIDEVVLK
jgi:translation initiation factor IF-2